jgi:aminoglycoside phosphotransferase (APT) family kinase protein
MGTGGTGSEAREGLDAGWQRALAWIERELGGRVARFELQPRWRPAMYLDLERAGERVPLYFRGDRGALDHGVYPLEHEMRVLERLEKHGIPVPHVHGFCPDPRGIVMQRCAGRTNLASAGSEAERTAVLDHYVEILAKLHRIDVAEFEALGLPRPRTPEALGLGDLAHWERSYRKQKRRPEPTIEFTLGWLRRNVPRGRTRAAMLHGDAGQFLFENGRVTSLLDFELAYVGDPMADFGGLRNRTLSEPLGDLGRAVARYEQLTGEPADRRAIDYHTVRFGLCTPMSTAHLVADPPPGVEYVQYLAWYLVYARLCLEVIAQMQRLPLRPPALPAEAETRHSAGFRALRETLATPPGADAQASYQLATARRAAHYLARADRFGPALEAENQADAARLLGRRPGSWQEADAELERFVLDAGPEHDAALVELLHRRTLRHESLLHGALLELEGARIEPLPEASRS